MRVTVVIPVHDHEAWVADAVRSAALQDPRPDRIVVVDDGSRDGSFEAVLGALDPGPRTAVQEGTRGAFGGVPVTVLRQSPAGGPSSARNRGIHHAWEGTDAFFFLDSDDVYLPGKVKRSLEALALSPDVGAAYTDYETVDPRTGVVVREYKEPFCRKRLFSECLPNMDSVVTKEALRACGVFDPEQRVCEDYDLWVRLSERFLVVHVPECLVRLRVGGHSSSARVPTKQWRECYARVFEKARRRAGGG